MVRLNTCLKHMFRCRETTLKDAQRDLEGAQIAAANYTSWLRASLSGSARVSSQKPKHVDMRSQAVAYAEWYLIFDSMFYRLGQ